MSRTRRRGVLPAYPTHPHQRGQARLTVSLPNGRRRDLYLGAFGSPESHDEYQRILTIIRSNHGVYPVQADGAVVTALTLNDVARRFMDHAGRYYRLLDGTPSREADHFELALRPLLALFGDTPPDQFGPLKLKTVRQSLIDARRYLVRFQQVANPDSPPGENTDQWLSAAQVQPDRCLAKSGEAWRPAGILKVKPALSRKVINQRMEHIKRFFAWAVSEELVPGAVHDALLRVGGLRRGHEGTRDMPKVQPVPAEHVQATLPYLAPQVAAMVQLQKLMGARPTEVCTMRTRNIVGMDRAVWMYRIDPNEVVHDDEPESRAASAEGRA